MGAYVGSTLHYETFLLEKPEAQEWLVPDYLGQPVIYGSTNRPPMAVFHASRAFANTLSAPYRVAIEEVKVDLFSFDHTSMQAEPKMFHHPLAIEDFRNFLRTKYKPEELKPWLGTGDVRYVVPPKVDWPLSTIDDRLFQEWMDFRCQMLARYYEEMAAFIHSLNPAVAIVTNPHVGLSRHQHSLGRGGGLSAPDSTHASGLERGGRLSRGHRRRHSHFGDQNL